MRIRTTSLLLMGFLFSLGEPTAAQDYGYLLTEGDLATIWWAEGAYKVMKDDPVPAETAQQVTLQSASREYEPFLLVIRPKRRMENVRILAEPLQSSSNHTIESNRISISHVEYVKVTVPTDDYGSVGEWPDPLPPYEGPFTLYPGANQPLWITVYVPPETPGGTYQGRIVIETGSWRQEIPLRLEVWDFSLPEETRIRSSFGLSAGGINWDTDNNLVKRYHNLETPEEARQVYDLYMQNFKEHRVCPTFPMSLYPMKLKIHGVYWKGGEFVSSPVHSGKRALKVVDNTVSANIGAHYENRIAVDPAKEYKISWYARSPEGKQTYTVLVECLNQEGSVLYGSSVLKVFEGTKDWQQADMEVNISDPRAEEVAVTLFPAFRDQAGSFTGTMFFDNLRFELSPSGQNLFEAGDFEMDSSQMSVQVDFAEFDKGARKYLDALKFNSFNLSLEGLGGGTFYSQRQGILGGFRQDTPEYQILLKSYLSQVERHLEENGWLGKEYVYWFDEPHTEHYPFVRKGMKDIREAAPRLTRFITEHRPGPDIMDVSEISCTIFHRIEPKIVADLKKQGREFWSYLCTGPKAPWVTLFIDHPAINLRMWLWMSFQYQLEGILVWSSNYWTSDTTFPEDSLQNPWEDPMAYRSGYGTPFGQVNYWGNGDGRFLYPPNRDVNNDNTKYLSGPVNSIRWEILREGIEDFEYLWLLRDTLEKANPAQAELVQSARKLLDIPDTVFSDGETYTKDPKVLLEYRSRVASVLEDLLNR